MPTFDGGHYFLSALIPIRTDEMKEVVKGGDAYTSPVHALRKRLDMLPTAGQAPGPTGRTCPFARNRRTHFVRLVIIDDVAYNGRDPSNAFLSSNNALTAAQPQDHLSCPFLLLAVDFDAKDGSAAERDSYLAELWGSMREDLSKIFTFCRGFDARVTDAASFAAYIADCQLETTMSFNDYYATVPDLPAWPLNAFKWAAIASGGVAALGLIGTLAFAVAEVFTRSLQTELRCAVALMLIAAAVFVVVLFTAYVTVMAAGAKPFPTAPDSDLPSVLKALHLQRAFTRFAIDNQSLAANGGAQSAQQLYDNFAAFVATNKPQELGEPTQAPGVIGI